LDEKKNIVKHKYNKMFKEVRGKKMKEREALFIPFVKRGLISFHFIL
jgi:ribosomal protein L19E